MQDGLDHDSASTALDTAPRATRYSMLLGLIIFGFGITAGFLVAFSGLGVIQDSASTIVAVFLVALVILTVTGLVLFILRGPILRRLFGMAETQIEAFAVPMSRVAESAAERDPQAATEAARELAQRVLARYSWLATRRWIIASLTALIAAMAALAGTALLYRQNDLLAQQSALLAEQNDKIREQTQTLLQDVQLAEAARNAGLAVEITAIAARLGDAVEAVAARAPKTGTPALDLTTYLDPVTDLPRGLIMRIVAASQGARPYRFLDVGLSESDTMDKVRVAMARRAGDLPNTYARMADAFGWQDLTDRPVLIDRPASPERGQLLRAMVSAGVIEFELLNFRGLDLSFAHAQGISMLKSSMQGARLSYADLSGAVLTEVDMGAAALENARFMRATIQNSSFASVPGNVVKPPFKRVDFTYPSFLSGADFFRAQVMDTTFAGAQLLAANFDDALLVGVDFSNAALAAATFRNTLLIAVNFRGADLSSVDFDGAVIFDDDPINMLAFAAANGTFNAERFRADPITLQDALGEDIGYDALDRDTLPDRTGGAAPMRLTRIADFTD